MEIAIIAYFANAAILTMGCVTSYRKQRVIAFFWGGLLLMHFLSLFEIKDLIQNFHSSTIAHGQLYMLGGNLCMIAALAIYDRLLLGNRRLPTLIMNDEIARRYYAVIAAVIVIALGVQFRKGFGVISSNWATARQSYDAGNTLSTFLAFLFYPSIWLALRQRRYMLGVVLGVVGFLLFLVNGSRAMFSAFVVAACIERLLANEQAASGLTKLERVKSRRIRIQTITFALLVLGCGHLAHESLRAFRGLGIGGFFKAVQTGTLRSRFDAEDVSSEATIYRYYYYVVERQYSYGVYSQLPTLRRIVLLYVPRSFSGGFKPYDVTTQIWLDALEDGLFDSSMYILRLRENAKNGAPGSLHPTFWGDAFANMKLKGILLYPLIFGFIFTLLERICTRLTPYGMWTACPAVGVAYLMAARGSVVLAFQILGFVIPIATVFGFIAGLKIWSRYVDYDEVETFDDLPPESDDEVPESAR